MNIFPKLPTALLTATLCSSLLLVSGNALAITAEEYGLQIAIEQDARDQGFNDSIADLDMVLTNEAGDVATRTLTIKTLEVNGDGDKTITLFNSPRDVKGTSLLTWSHALKGDDQWLYLPALKRVKRVSSKNKSGSFMGSEFSYEDLSSQEVEKYTYKYLRDENYNGMDSFVVEQYPTYAYSGYSRQIVWIDKEHYTTLKVEYYDKGNALLKTLYQSEHKQYKSKYWRAGKMKMVNHQNGKKTDLNWKDYEFGNNLNASLFTKNRLVARR